MNYEDRLTERAKNALNYAYSAAAELGHGYVGSEHILIGLTRERDSAAARCLRNYGFDDSKLKELSKRPSAEARPPPSPPRGLPRAQSASSNWRRLKPRGSVRTI
jgi:ATP-dependent Clp protease ATP-binding subunit ClpC